MRKGLLALGLLLAAVAAGVAARHWLVPKAWWEDLPGTPADAEALQAIRAAQTGTTFCPCQTGSNCQYAFQCPVADGGGCPAEWNDYPCTLGSDGSTGPGTQTGPANETCSNQNSDPCMQTINPNGCVSINTGCVTLRLQCVCTNPIAPTMKGVLFTCACP